MQLLQMAQQLNPELKDAYMKDPDTIMEEARKGNMASFVNSTTNLLVACSIHMRDGRRTTSATPMETETPAPERPLKRKAEEEVVEQSEPVDPLSAALQFSFNNDSVDCV